jgi:hypothetical protein
VKKFTVSILDKPKFNSDGLLTLYFQHDSQERISRRTRLQRRRKTLF